MVAVLVYLLAVFHRSSLAVAGLAASERFGISAAQLATFTMLQLLVYAGMQIPVGLLVDRFGPRRVLLTGSVLMLLGQTAFALASTFPVALAARVCVGVGDAMTFICVLRLVTTWFAPRRIPLMTQVTGMLGQLGAVVAALPMTWALGQLGWTRSYLLAASVGLVLAVALLAVVHDGPTSRSLTGPALSLTQVRASLSASWAQPGTRLGFWIHFTTPFSGTTLGLLWGYPFLVRGEGHSEQTAGVLLTVMVVAVIAVGPVLGWAIGRHPWHRSSVAIGIVLAIVASWTLVLAWPGQAPMPLLVLLIVMSGIGGPTSLIGFEMGRMANPAERQSSATGIINQAGFVSTLLVVLAIGLVLDWRTPGGGTDYTPAAFQAAMSCQYVLWGLGLVQVLRYRRRTRERLRADDPQAYARMRKILA
ncbi:MFS transporter [Nocardioides sp. zg-536]|uniref:MFS transporter n=2 Tax=Nocardioides faecalis TaxID=2803858 RepID=A0A938Y352_9ACTN|nr:MFS transporter [Nocardioides faecalis]MBS4752083.1 MFS transporter [Nocardioides faecalis]QVI60408.1 MFS transporter [Nocardioides faecalis]